MNKIKKNKSVVLLILVIPILIFSGCSGGITGNPYIDDTATQIDTVDYSNINVPAYSYELPSYIVGDTISISDFINNGTVSDTSKTILIDNTSNTVAKYKINTFAFYISPIEFSGSLGDITTKDIATNTDIANVLGDKAVIDTSTFEKAVDDTTAKINAAITDEIDGQMYSGYISMLQDITSGNTYMMYIVFADSDTELTNLFLDLPENYNDNQSHQIVKSFTINSTADEFGNNTDTCELSSVKNNISNINKKYQSMSIKK